MNQNWRSLNKLIIKAASTNLTEEDVASIAKLVNQTATEGIDTPIIIPRGTMVHLKDRLYAALRGFEEGSCGNRSREDRVVALENARDALEDAFVVMLERAITPHTIAIAYYRAACAFALGSQDDAQLWLAKTHAALVQCAKQMHEHNEMHMDVLPGHANEMLSIGVMRWIKSLLRRRNTRRELCGTCLKSVLQSLRELENQGVLKLPPTSSEDTTRVLNYMQSLINE